MTSILPQLHDASDDLEDTARLPAMPDAAEEATAERPQLAAHDTAAISSLQALTENLRDLERTLQTKSEQLTRFEREVGLRDGRIMELERLVSARESELARSNSAQQDLRQSLDLRSAEIEQLRGSNQIQSATQLKLQSELAERVAALNFSESQTQALQRQIQLHNEVLQTNQSRRQFFNQLLDDRDQRESELQTRLSALQTQLAAEQESASTRESTLRSTGESQLAESQALRAELDATRAQLRELDSSTQQRHAGLSQAHEELGERLKTQEAEASTLRAHHQEALTRIERLNTDLLAAEQQLRAEAGQLRQQHQQLEQLTQKNQELQTELAASRQTVAQRDELVAKLQSEVAEGAKVLGGIQHQLGHLGEAVDQAPDRLPPPSRLLMRMEDGTEIVHLLGRKTVIGRDHDCQLRLQTSYISRHHAVVTVTPQGATIEDLNSTNGVYVNGKRVKHSALVDGDDILIGKTPFKLLSRPVVSPH